MYVDNLHGTTVPTVANTWYPKAYKQVIGPPAGVPEKDIKPIEMLEDVDLQLNATVFRAYLELTKESIEAIKNADLEDSFLVELSVYAPYVVPFALNFIHLEKE